MKILGVDSQFSGRRCWKLSFPEDEQVLQTAQKAEKLVCGRSPSENAYSGFAFNLSNRHQ